MKKIKILHVLPSINLKFGGPSKSVPDLCNGLANNEMQTDLVTKKTINDYFIEKQSEKFKIRFLKIKFPNIFSVKLINFLFKTHYDLYHGHGLWSLSISLTFIYARLKRKPYIITPRGMLEPWALNEKKYKKKLAWMFFQKKDILKSNCIHATSIQEAKNIRQLGFINPITVIPNGIDINIYPLKNNEISSSKKTLLFLSRIHKKKGIDILIKAWSKIDKNIKANWQINIAGTGEESYLNELKSLVNEKGLEHQINFIGEQYGGNKISTYHNADIFILPTHSENFGIVVAEALACGVPVITTKGAPWEELLTNKAGWWINVGEESLTNCLNKVLLYSREELQFYGNNGRNLIIQKYSIKSASKNMKDTYSWILNGSAKPNCIY